MIAERVNSLLNRIGFGFMNLWGLLALIGIPLLILIYLIRHRYHEKTVSSTYLWKRTRKKMKRKIPFNLYRIFLLLIQILSIVVFSLLLSRPYVVASESSEVIAIIDASSSMLATDAGGMTRFDRAKEEVRKFAAETDDIHKVTIITAGESAKTDCYRATQPSVVENALDTIQCGMNGANVAEALKNAQAVQLENADARIIYYTDVAYENVEGLTTVLINDNEWNAAILSLEAPTGNSDFSGKVISYGRDAKLNLELHVDGERKRVISVDCEAGIETEYKFVGYSGSQFNKAEVKLVFDTELDGLALDNTFSVFSKGSTVPRVEIIYAPGSNEVLTDAIPAGIMPVPVHIDELTADGYEKRQNSSGIFSTSKISYSGFDAYIFVGILPERIPHDGTTWLLNPPSIPDKLNLGVKMYTARVAEGSVKDFKIKPGVDAEELGTLNGLTLTKTNTDTNDKGAATTYYNPLEVDTTVNDFHYKTLFTCTYQGTDEPSFLMGTHHQNFSRVIISTLGKGGLEGSLGLEYTLFLSNLMEYAVPTAFEPMRSTMDGKQEPIPGGNSQSKVNISCNIGEWLDITLPAGSIGITLQHEESRVELSDAGVTDFNDYTPDQMLGKDGKYTLPAFDTPGIYTATVYVVYLDDEGVPEIEKEIVYSCTVTPEKEEGNLSQVETALLESHPAEGSVSKVEPVEIWIFFLIALLVILMAEWWVYYFV